jgi:hypothetical protein
MRTILAVLLTVLPLLGQEALKKPVRITKTESLPFAPNGTIHVNGSFGSLTVEGWDELRVEIVVTRSLNRYYDPELAAEAGKLLDLVQVSTQRRSDTDLEISTAVSRRNPADFRLPGPLHKSSGATVDYEIHVPRQSNLVIHHGIGYVQIGNIDGNIEATAHRGDIVLMLPQPGAYAIDAKSTLGPVVSGVKGQARLRRLMGEGYVATAPSPSRRIWLRMGFGGITIEPVAFETP